MNKRTAAFAIGTLAIALYATGLAAPAMASHTAEPSAVTVAGSLQDEQGCSSDWDPGCGATQLTYLASDEVWQRTFAVSAGSWEYKAALNGSWTENYGANAVQDGANVALSVAATTNVKVYYDHDSHWITDSQTEDIAVAAGSFQSELGCPGDWQPDCLRSWLQDPDGDGIHSFSTTAIPAGSYETKVAIDEDWTENYGAGGAANGANVAFSVPVDGEVRFSYDASTHVLTVTPPTAPGTTGPPDPPAGPSEPQPGAGDTAAPETTIADGPKARTRRKRATFEFASSEAGSTFECSLDGGPFASCASPKTVKVGRGRHTFKVRATDHGGNTDPSPATFGWRVRR